MCVQLCLILCNPTDCIPLGSFVHGILQARILEWVAVLPVQGSNPGVLQLQADFLLSEPLGKPFLTMLSITLSNFPGTHYTSLLHFSPCPIPSPPQSFFCFSLFMIFGWAGSFLLCGLVSKAGWGNSVVALLRLLVWGTGSRACGFAVVMAPRLRSTASVVVVHRLSRSEECGILQDQGLNPCLLHWQEDSLPLSYHGSPTLGFLEIENHIFIAEVCVWYLIS